MGSSERPANREAKNSAQRPAAQQPVVHDNQPTDADHRPPTQGEVVGDAKLAGKLSHGVETGSDQAHRWVIKSQVVSAGKRTTIRHCYITHTSSYNKFAANSDVISPVSYGGDTSTRSQPTMFSPRKLLTNSRICALENPPTCGVPVPGAKAGIHHVDVERHIHGTPS